MTRYQRSALKPIRVCQDSDQAVVMLHGFGGNRDDTWDRFPNLLANSLADWDIYTLGYPSRFLPDLFGIWSSDPDLPTLAISLATTANIEPLDGYSSLALVGHSMGGLVAQRAILDNPQLAARTAKLALFGTPSAGLRKARFSSWWKKQLRNMTDNSEFIKALRSDWQERADDTLRLDVIAVAGEEDQFVPPESSIEPFPRECQRVVPGDHVTIVKPADAASHSVSLLKSFLAGETSPLQATDQLTLAAEAAHTALPKQFTAAKDGLSEEEVVRTALALERSGRRDEATAFLQRHQALGTDVRGTLAGRIKRMWTGNENPEFAHHALDLYQEALDIARQADDGDQISYHAINAAFLHHVAFSDFTEAVRLAGLALDYAVRAPVTMWSTATKAEAHLYLGNHDQACDYYRQLGDFDAETWQFASTGVQAAQVASKLEDEALADTLQGIFAQIGA